MLSPAFELFKLTLQSPLKRHKCIDLLTFYNFIILSIIFIFYTYNELLPIGNIRVISCGMAIILDSTSESPLMGED